MIRRVVYFIAAIAICLAVYKSVPHSNVDDIRTWANQRVEQVGGWLHGVVEWGEDKAKHLPKTSSLIPDNEPHKKKPHQSATASPTPR